MFLDQARGREGKLSLESRRLILTFMQHPSVEAWDAISGIVICWDNAAGGSITVINVWQAVIALDKRWMSAVSGAYWQPRGDWESLPPEQKWEAFPDPITTARAIQRATVDVKPPRRQKRRR